jgi:myo-inositol 2-dehydrogenase/D-chiro-inositol 1-dehydrogenase
MSHMKTRFALIGFGAWGRFHAQAIAENPAAELAVIATPSPASQQAAREQFPAADVVGDWRAAIARDDLEVVDVVVPSFLHHEIGRAALIAGKHLLLEKPMTLTIADCDDLIATAVRHDRLLAVGHELRLSSLWGEVKRLIDAGTIGEPQYALIELSRHPYRQGAGGWRYDIHRVGNWVLEEPIHFFDLARWYLQAAGEPVRVFATANSRQPGHPELQDNFSAIVHFSRGGYAVVSQTLSAFEHHQSAKISGTHGALWAGWSGAQDRTRHPTFFLKVFDGERLTDCTPTRITGEVFELADQIAALIAAVRTGHPLPARGDDGRWSVALCLAAQRSVDVGQPVELNEVLAAR